MGEAKRKKNGPARGPRLLVHRLVILEWLSEAEDEPKTGTALANKLLQASPELSVTCYRCTSANDVLGRISALTKEMSAPGVGVPILHIEAHGYNPMGENDSALGLAGPSQDGTQEALLWKDLADPLRRLNIATSFNLMFVAAACWGDNAIYEVHKPGTDIRPLPFLFAVGFATEVMSHRLESAMVELYTNLLLNNLTLQESLELAHSKLDPATEGLAWFSLPRIIRNVAIDTVLSFSDPARNEEYYLQMLTDLALAGQQPIPPDEYHRRQLTHAPAAIDSVVGALLAYDIIPENRARFGFDGRKLAAEARRILRCRSVAIPT